MPASVLSVGNCAADHGAISHLIESHFDASVSAAHSFDEALTAIRSGQYQLVLVNRLFDHDGSPGLDLVQAIQTDGLDVPLMLITNYEDYQKQAVAAGAKPGFGKAELSSPETLERLRPYLTE